MRIIDTMDGIEAMASAYDGNSDNLLPLWKTYMENMPKIRDLCESDLEEGDLERVVPIMHEALTVKLPAMREAHVNFKKAVFKIETAFHELCGGKEDTALYYYMGLANAAGWAAMIDGEGAMLIGAAKIAELGWQGEDQMLGLVSHELAHDAHRILRGESISKDFDTMEDTWAWRLYIEGFAQKNQQLLQGNGDYHQDDGEWLDYCRRNLDRLKNVYKERLVEGKSAQDFYGDWTKFEGVADLGYYLGAVWVSALQERYTNEQIARFELDKIKSEVYDFLNS
ncbi:MULTISPECIES: hypothetical protein [unclassified Fusibacter]|uniref:hypothetical protein n=1 Tax=unclassified Fusibacter TaxID=2624464 RepID=UPI00101086F3|nr:MULTISPECIES: hypothetical protein [unclassified Fusibacter]MCK8061569.1 hypothetical protein [Fusibacter sp. A2]NPE23703.1 hypothetical protein [Fusibacter sp. A1]RXV58730.1 hypothetical protein DWB64_18120 [Fusibacter sp. A1]